MTMFAYLIVCVVCLSAVRAGQVGFSVSYFAHPEHPQVVNADFVSSSQPSAVQIADMYNRLSGFSPLLVEEKEDLPGIDVLSGSKVQPILLEIFGSDLPQSVTPVLRSQFENSLLAQGPSAQAVKDILKENGVDARVAIYMAGDAQQGQSVGEWIAEHARAQPVVILHHAAPVAVSAEQRRLQKNKNTKGDGASGSGSGSDSTSKSSKSSTVAELTEFQISEYQICLWTGVGFVLLLLASVGSIANMEVLPDSLLYAKFQSGRTGRSD